MDEGSGEDGARGLSGCGFAREGTLLKWGKHSVCASSFTAPAILRAVSLLVCSGVVDTQGAHALASVPR